MRPLKEIQRAHAEFTAACFALNEAMHRPSLPREERAAIEEMFQSVAFVADGLGWALCEDASTCSERIIRLQVESLEMILGKVKAMNARLAAPGN